MGLQPAGSGLGKTDTLTVPEKANFLNDRQKYIATSRVSLEKEGAHAEHVTFKNVLKVLWDWKIGVYCIQFFVVSSSIYSLNFFLPIILRDNLGTAYCTD